MADDFTPQIEKLLKDLNKSLAAIGGIGGDTRLKKKAIEEVRRQISLLEKQKNNLTSNNTLLKKLNDQLRAAEDALEDYTKSVEELETVQKRYKKVLQDTFDNTIKLGDAQTKGYDKLTYFTQSFKDVPFLAGLNKLAGSLDYNADNYRQLAAGGADFGKSLINMREAARTAQLGLEDFKKLVIANQPTLAGLYGTVNKGVDGLAQMSENLRTVARKDLYELGLSTEDLSKFQGTYLERQLMQGRRDYLNGELAAKQTVAYIKELNVLSRLTGIQNEELDKQVKARQDDGVFQAYLSSLNEEEARKTETLIATLTAVNGPLGETAKNLLATGVPLDDLGQKLTALAPGFQEAILAFKQSGDVGTTLQALKNSGQDFNARFKGTSGAATLLAGDLSGAANAVLKLGNMSMDTAAAQAELNKKADPLTKELMLFQDSAKRLKAAFEGIQTSFLASLPQFFIRGFGGFNDSLISVANNISKFAKENPGKVAAAYTTAMAAKYGADMAKEIFIVSTGVRIGNAGLGNALGNFGKQIGNIGTGVGKIGGGVLKALPFVGAGISAIDDIYNVASEKGNKNAGYGGLVGGGIGAALGALAGPMGAALGYSAGSFIGSSLGTMFDSKASGGPLTIGKPTLVGEKGPELILPKSSGTVAPLIMSKTTAGTEVTPTTSGDNKTEQLNQLVNTLTTTMGGMSESLTKSEKHLNKLIEVGLMQVDKATELKNSVAQLDYAIVK